MLHIHFTLSDIDSMAKRNKMTSEEIDAAIDRIRATYIEYEKKYDGAYFKVLNFEDRYIQALRSRINLEMFIKAEESAIIAIQKKIEDDQKETRIRNDKTFTKKVDKMIDDFQSRIEKYDDIDFHPDADAEVRHLFGALREFYEKYWIPIKQVFPPMSDFVTTKKINALTDKLQPFAVSSRNRPPGRFDEYITQVMRGEHPGIRDQAHRSLLTDTAIMLNEIYDFLVSIRPPYPDDAFVTHEVDPSANPSRFRGNTNLEVYQIIVDKLLAVLRDFRLEELRKR